MRAVITGATGMLGATLAREWLSQGAHVTAIIRPGSVREGYLPQADSLETIACGLEGYADCSVTADHAADVFYHLAWGGTNGAARSDPLLQAQNVPNAVEAVRLAHRMGCRRFIGVGSQAEYGLSSQALAPDSPTSPITAYGAAKLAASALCGLEARRLGMEFIWVRVFSVYGPMDQCGSLFMSTIGKLLAGETPSFTKGEQQWDFLYSEDAARALRLIGERGMPGALYCLGHGDAAPLADAIRVIYRHLAPEQEPPLGTLPYAAGQVMHLEADIRTLTHDTGFTPQIPLDDGLRRTIQWCKEQNGK